MNLPRQFYVTFSESDPSFRFSEIWTYLVDQTLFSRRVCWLRWSYQIFDIFNIGTFWFLKLQGSNRITMKPLWYKVIFTRIDRANDFIRLVHLTNDFLFMVPKPQSDNLRKSLNRILYTSYCVTLIQKPTIVKLSLISLLSILPLNSNNISAFWPLLTHFIKIRIWFYLLEHLFIQFSSY